MNTPQIFSFEQHEVRTFLENDIPYFVANDVAKTLGYKNPSKATNDHCKKSIETWGNDSLGRRQKIQSYYRIRCLPLDYQIELTKRWKIWGLGNGRSPSNNQKNR